ncbi:MAG: peptidyl-prolyl cis-trans isomerase [Muribaculaceae bacterium]|nr:peptidyl-prolyl cis-trans isomerase [Roseburia sp.]MCM1430217.1 peptidyl-prolyl cis-trans isomerase [Muribaculaceae bacterium]MCM1493701.1 peptidyl-prolyl cis-trans isomerase [Muribaculaceae bacterium]
MRVRRIAAGLLAAVCALSVCTGCRVGDTELVWKADKLGSHKYVFTVNGTACDIRQAKLYLCNYRNLYGNAYGMDLWEQDYGDESLEQYVKDVTLQELSSILCMELLAKQMDMELTDAEQELAAKAAAEYYASLGEAELAYMELRESDVVRAYGQYALAKKLYDSLTYGIDEEVSDDEARVITVQQIFVLDQETAGKVEEKLAAGDDFAAVASAYNQTGEIERTVARDELPQEVENIAFNLDNGAVSDCIETEDGCYFIKCLSKLEEELTEENKENIRKKRRMAQFDEVYQTFVDSAEFELNTEIWDEIALEKTDGITTDSFFEIYSKYFSE